MPTDNPHDAMAASRARAQAITDALDAAPWVRSYTGSLRDEAAAALAEAGIEGHTVTVLVWISEPDGELVTYHPGAAPSEPRDTR